MSSKKIAIFRNIGVGLIFLLGIVSCEKDLENIAVDLTGQQPFVASDSTFEVIAYNHNIDSSRVDNNVAGRVPLSLLGVNSNNVFGFIDSDLISQVQLPIGGVDFGDDPVIDRVVLDLPYFATRDGDQKAVDPITGGPILDAGGDTIAVPNFVLDSIYGKQDVAYKMTVFELGTFLNSLDPENPTKANAYYSDKEFTVKEQLYQGDFKPNRNDTVIYVERRYIDDDPSTIDAIDTIKLENAAPSIKFDLNKEFFQQYFVDNGNSFDFENNENFVSYFRGLYIDADGFDGSIMNLRGSDGTMTIYFTSDVIGNEPEGEDLNGNGVSGEIDVMLRTAQAQRYTFTGVRTAKYERSYTGAEIQRPLEAPDTENGESKLYVQGAAGSEAIIQILSQETVDYLRQQNLLINEANLTFYIDGDQGEIPDRLFLYKYDYDSFVNDYYNIRFGPELVRGQIEYNDEGKPESYKFRITDYISKVLKADDPIAISKMALKNYVSSDLPDGAIFDTIVPNWNWIPKGVVLHGNKPKENDKRIKLEIYYSK